MPLKKLVIWVYRDAEFKQQVGLPLSVAINPDEYSHSYGIQYNNNTGQGGKRRAPQFNQMGSERVSFVLWFDGTGVVPNTPRGDTTSIDRQITKFRQTVVSYDGKVHRPNFLKLSWGTLLFQCCLDKLDVTYTLFTPAGEPIRAKCAVSFSGYTSARAAAAEAQDSSPDVAHLVTVRAGDSLPQLCHQIYGSSVHYPKVARFNGLGSFRALKPGTQLLFPRLRQSER